MIPLEQARRVYAEEVRLAGGVESDALVEAFARVPRERFLGPGPWEIPWAPRRLGERWSYRPTPDTDPRRLCHNVVVAIDRERELHNGLPSFLAFKIDAAGVRPGDRVVHVGAGVGYYSAIMAELAGAGTVVAIELDAGLAERARANLAPWAQVEVVCADGASHDAGPADVYFINAGATYPAPLWLDRLADGGRLILPLTHRNGRGSGIVLRVARSGSSLAARAISGIAVFDCAGARDDDSNRAVGEALRRGGTDEIRSLRPADHGAADTCWAHLREVCVSKLEP